FDVRVVPHPKNFMELLMSDLTGGNDGDDGHLQLDVKSLMLQQLQSDALSMLATVDPSRASAIRQVMLQLHILQKERVSLTMPALHLSGP
ncbi:MAG: hypothetical protein KDA81_16390, partial [Planctomycetaceae bacterium]|nr:hypothetical protein [Planctomycetaceae bacterium]